MFIPFAKDTVTTGLPQAVPPPASTIFEILGMLRIFLKYEAPSLVIVVAHFSPGSPVLIPPSSTMVSEICLQIVVLVPRCHSERDHLEKPVLEEEKAKLVKRWVLGQCVATVPESPVPARGSEKSRANQAAL